MSETNNPTVTLPLEFAWQLTTLTNLALTYLDDQVNEARNMKWRIGMYKKLKEADTIHNELKAYIAEAENYARNNILELSDEKRSKQG